MSACCDGCTADATHRLCDGCLDNEGRDALRAEVERLTKERDEALGSNERMSALHTELHASAMEWLAEVERLRGLLDQNETEAHRLIRWRREAEADAERLRLALRGLLREVEGGEHHPEECPRCADCDDHGEGGCRRCGGYDCPECECGLAETLRAIAAAREALAWSGSQPSET